MRSLRLLPGVFVLARRAGSADRAAALAPSGSVRPLILIHKVRWDRETPTHRRGKAQIGGDTRARACPRSGRIYARPMPPASAAAPTLASGITASRRRGGGEDSPPIPRRSMTSSRGHVGVRPQDRLASGDLTGERTRDLPLSRQRGLVGTIRRLLRDRTGPEELAARRRGVLRSRLIAPEVEQGRGPCEPLGSWRFDSSQAHWKVAAIGTRGASKREFVRNRVRQGARDGPVLIRRAGPP
jgi:hypothetical protein